MCSSWLSFCCLALLSLNIAFKMFLPPAIFNYTVVKSHFCFPNQEFFTVKNGYAQTQGHNLMRTEQRLELHVGDQT